jgi:hypothetical protein
MGFQDLHELIPNVVGNCLADEHYRPSNGNGLQETTGPNGKGGLLVWRKADNVTAFTDGGHTWLLGPFGLQVRSNTARFPWETQSPEPAAAGCRGGASLANVHDPDRLTIVRPCMRVTGTLASVTKEPDGDVFMDLAVTPGERGLLNAGNLSAQNGNLVVELVPADQPGCTVGQPPLPPEGTADFGLCTGADIPTPAAGAAVTVFGPYVFDTNHGWMEIHPVWTIYPAA